MKSEYALFPLNTKRELHNVGMGRIFNLSQKPTTPSFIKD